MLPQTVENVLNYLINVNIQMLKKKLNNFEIKPLIIILLTFVAQQRLTTTPLTVYLTRNNPVRAEGIIS